MRRSCKALDGIKPARVVLSNSFRACHQYASSCAQIYSHLSLAILDLLPVTQYAKYHPFEIRDQLLGRGCRHHFQGCNQNRPLLVLCFHAAHTYCRRVQVWKWLLLHYFAKKKLARNEARTSTIKINWFHTKIVKTSAGVFPSTLILLTSITSSPTWIRPLRSAAPPTRILAMIILPVSSSVLIVAP